MRCPMCETCDNMDPNTGGGCMIISPPVKIVDGKCDTYRPDDSIKDIKKPKRKRSDRKG